MLKEFKGEVETFAKRLSPPEACRQALGLLDSIERIYAEPLELPYSSTKTLDLSADGLFRDLTAEELQRSKAVAVARAEAAKARLLSRLFDEVRDLKRHAERLKPGVVAIQLVPSSKRGEVISLGEAREDAFEKIARDAKSVPQNLGVHEGHTYYWLRGKVWFSRESLTPEDVSALVSAEEGTKKRRLEKAHALAAMREQPDLPVRRQPIPHEIKLAVWQRDLGRCVECASQRELEYDHIIPLAMGGSNTERNLQLLCAVCNRRKGATLG